VLADSAARGRRRGAEFAAALAEVRDRLPKVREVVVLGGDGDEYEKWLAAAEPVIERVWVHAGGQFPASCIPRERPAGRRARC